MATGYIARRDREGLCKGTGCARSEGCADLAVVIAQQRAELVVGKNGDGRRLGAVVLDREGEEDIAASLGYAGGITCLCDRDVRLDIGVGDRLVIGGRVGVAVIIGHGCREGVDVAARDIARRDGEGLGEGTGCASSEDCADLAVVIAQQRTELVVGENRNFCRFGAVVLDREGEENVAASFRHARRIANLGDRDVRLDIG